MAENIDREFKRISDKLADDQRGEPENAMLRLQNAQISQLYGYVAEHIGDLTNRIAESVDFFQGNYGNVLEKVNRCLNYLTDRYGFERESLEQIQHNLPFIKYDDVEKARIRLRELSQAYADEHRKLVVANEAQRNCRDAAVAFGQWEFNEAIRLLRILKSKLDEGREAWKSYALHYE